jgi:hypothetical protein
MHKILYLFISNTFIKIIYPGDIKTLRIPSKGRSGPKKTNVLGKKQEQRI